VYPKDQINQWFAGQGLWTDTPVSDWKDWHWQLRKRFLSANDFKQHINLTESEEDGFSHARQKLLVAVTPYYFNLIDRNDPECPIRKQVIPRREEMITSTEELLDPVGEEKTKPVEGLIHRYPDRVLFLVTSYCAAYCRYCTRSRLVSNAQDYDFHPNFDQAIKYIEDHKEIRDVLISGGDPLLLPDRKLSLLFERLRAIDHVEFIRLGSRIPVFMPQRITPELCDIFKKYGPLWLSIHVNHPKECTIELKEACEKLICSKVVIGNQSVLLKGVNDKPEILMSLSHRLLQMGVRPYYLYQCDLITGSSHFRTDVKRGIEIIEKMRGHTTGYAIPQFVVDAPGGGGKIPLNPNYLVSTTETEVVLRNFKNEQYTYPAASQHKLVFADSKQQYCG
jgi:lysine 2,3-aminomutase